MVSILFDDPIINIMPPKSTFHRYRLREGSDNQPWHFLFPRILGFIANQILILSPPHPLQTPSAQQYPHNVSPSDTADLVFHPVGLLKPPSLLPDDFPGIKPRN
jgi:hypothetical protein